MRSHTPDSKTYLRVIGSRAHEHVLRLDVAVHDALAMAVQQREGEGLDDGSRCRLGDSIALLDAVKQVPSWAELHDDVDVLVREMGGGRKVREK